MLTQIYHVLQKQPVLTLFLIIGMGYLIGGFKVRGFSLGSVAGVLFAGLFFGHFGFKMSPGAQSVGFALFIFSVGYQAGPRFFDVLMEDGLKYFLLALVIASSGLGLSVLAAKIFTLPPGTAAGILAGGLTSSPTLAAAQEAIRSGNMLPPAGVSPETVIGNITTGYAITYIFGLIGLITIIKVLPGFLGIDLAAEARELEGKESSAKSVPQPEVGIRVYRVDNEAFTKMPALELKKRFWDGYSVTRVERDDTPLEFTLDDYLQIGDVVTILGKSDYFTDELKTLGEEITAQRCTQGQTDTAQVIVTHKDVVGKTLAELNLAANFGVFLVAIRRMRIPLKASPELTLKKGDILTVTGPADYIDLLGETLGIIERDIAETDMLTFAFGIAAGSILGLFSV